jgi:hypothetical protein
VEGDCLLSKAKDRPRAEEAPDEDIRGVDGDREIHEGVCPDRRMSAVKELQGIPEMSEGCAQGEDERA